MRVGGVAIRWETCSKTVIFDIPFSDSSGTEMTPSHLQPFVENQNVFLVTISPPRNLTLNEFAINKSFCIFTSIALHSDLKTACSLTRHRVFNITYVP